MASYDLVILSHTSCKSIESLVQELLVILDKVGDPYLEYKLSEALLFEQNSNAILDNISQEQGAFYQEKFRELDVETALRPTLQLVAREAPDTNTNAELYTCPSCKHTQPKQKTADAMDTCESCGVVGEKFKKHERREEVYQLEKHKLEQTQNRQMQDAYERAQHDEEKAMRDEARQKLGLKSKRHYGTALAGLGIVAVIGATAYFIADKMRQGSSTTTEQIAENSATGDAQDSKLAENNAASPIKQAASAAPEDTTNTPQSLVTIQGGNGSIVVNNNPQNTAESTGKGGKGGSKGNTAGEAEGTQTEGSQTTVASVNNTQQQSNMQLAALAPTRQHTTAAQEAVANTATITATSTAVAQKPEILAGINASANHIRQLKDMLQIQYKQPKQFFSKLSQQQFTEHQQRLNRLLALNKPDLALIFAEGIEDPYLASLLILEVASYARKKSNKELNDAILLGIKAQLAKSSSLADKAMLNASLSQAYDFSGDQTSAREKLKQSVEMLNHENISVAQSCKLLTQIDQNHRQFGNQNGADFMAGTLIEFANKLPAKAYRYRAEIYTHLAATALRDGKQEDAAEWLKHIPVQNAQSELLSELETILAKNKFSKTQ